MAEFDHGLKMIAETTGRQLALLAGVECQQWRPAESTLQLSVEKLADRVFLARQGGKRFVVYFEFYTQWDRNAPWDMLAKSGLLSQRERLPTVCIAVVLQRRGFRSSGGHLRLEAGSGPTQQLWFKEVCLWQLTPEAWWEDQPGLMALYPLCQHGRPPREAISHAAAAIERKVHAPGLQGETLALLAIFGELAFPRLDVEHLIGSEKMKESKILRRWRKEGELSARREDLIKVVRSRFGEAFAAEVAETVNAIEDSVRLEQLFDALVLEGISQSAFHARLTTAEATA
jgi:hypothetical protein